MSNSDTGEAKKYPANSGMAWVLPPRQLRRSTIIASALARNAIAATMVSPARSGGWNRRSSSRPTLPGSTSTRGSP